MPGTSATTDAVATFAYDLLTRHHDARPQAGAET